MDRKHEEEIISLGDILNIVIRNWYWYAISLVICLGVAFYKVKKSPVVYERHAMVLIKSQGAYSQMQDEAAMFRELGMPSDGGYLIDNELLVFKSRRLMEEVVRRLDLDVDYYTTGHFREWSRYGNTPVKLRFPDADEFSRFSLKMQALKNHKVLLYDFNAGGESFSSEIEAGVGDTIITPVGRVVLEQSIAIESASSIGDEICVRKNDLYNVASSLNARLVSSPASKTSTIIKLSITDVSPKRAEDVLNTLVRVYDEDAVNDKNRVARNTEAFIAEQIEILESELNDIDMIIANYKSTNKLTDLRSDASAFRATVSSIEQKYADLQNQRAVAQFILSYIQDRESDPKTRYDVVPNNAGLSSQQVESLISEYNAQTILRDKLMIDAGESNPQVVDLTKSIDQMRARIAGSIHNLIKSLDIEIEDVRKRVGTSNSRLSEMPTQQKTVTGVERQQTTKAQLYLYLMNKRQENALSECITSSNARILDPAMGSNSPVEPKQSFIMMCGAMTGLLIPTALLFLLMVADRKIRSKKDLSKIASIPLVGEIPHMKGLDKSKDKVGAGRRIVFSAQSRDSVAESIRILRTNISFLGKRDEKSKVIMLTSFLPGSGKTFIGINLGMSLAASGSKVLMIDLDIRKGTLSAEYNKGNAGISDYLGGMEKNVDEIIVHSAYHENLDLIPVGHKAPNPAELLMDQSLDSLVASMKEIYDYIILDCVPANIVADAIICNRVADITLFIIRAGNLDKRLLPEIKEMYESGKLKNMAVVLNGLSDSHVYGSGYGYGYGQRKYYGYK